MRINFTCKENFARPIKYVSFGKTDLEIFEKGKTKLPLLEGGG
jgi:hypothetical protein